MRQGTAEKLQHRPAELVLLVQQMMSPGPDQRPCAGDILLMAEVEAVVGREDVTLLSAKSVTTDNGLCRSESFHPIFSPNGLGSDTSDEYMNSLLERALTPH